MRILKIFFSSLLIIGLLLVIAVFFGRGLLLSIASQQLQQAQEQLSKHAHLTACREQFTSSDQAWGQLRFTDARHYQLETVCSDFVKKPIVLDQRSLPLLVRKSAGASGFTFDEEQNPSQITLSCLGKKIVVFSEENQLDTAQEAPNLSYVAGPPASCQAFSYQCCREEVQQGVGTVQSLAEDCPRSCYASCQGRPLIVSFVGRPITHANSQQVEVQAGLPASFAFVVSDGQQELFADQLVAKSPAGSQWWQAILTALGQAEPAAVAQAPIITTIDFGDGQDYQTEDLQDTIEHVYTCKTDTCYFTAQISALDQLGSQAVSNESSQITVKVYR